MSSRPLRNLDLLGGGDEFNVTAHTKEGQQVEIRYIRETAVGNGSFGVVYKARIAESNEVVAIKKVLQDRRFKNRELQIMKLVSHPNIVDLKYFFYTNGFKKSEVYLNLILEFVPETIYRASRASSRNFTSIPEVLVKLYTYQLFRALIYIHSMGICHRDIKPQNLLLDSERGVVKLCDFGSAKVLTPGEVNVAYICSRYYRAPELVFGATAYTTSIDIWSTGCVMAELMRGAPLFAGETGIDQLIEIIKVIGTPTSEQVRSMNPSYMEHRFPQIKPKELPAVLRYDLLPSGVDLLEKILVYNPAERITAVDALVHPYFDELREPSTKLPTGAPLPPLFNFTAGELSVKPELISKMVPPHLVLDLSQSLGLADLSQFKPIPSEQLRIPSLG